MSKKVLFVAQEITPFVPESHMSVLGKTIPHLVQGEGNEIRTFHPKWGNINERRNQLHEVIRLSGKNISIDETDHPLLIKVASLPATKMQVYFIDNEDFFLKRLAVCDREGVEYNDNYERAVFYGRSVLETVKKLSWFPDVIVCQSWISSVIPFLVKKIYNDEEAFANAKIITSLHKIDITKPMPERFPNFAAYRNVTAEEVSSYPLTYKVPTDLQKFALYFSDGVVVADPEVDSVVTDYAKELNLPMAQYDDKASDKENALQLNSIIQQL
jgi:starch synthase